MKKRIVTLMMITALVVSLAACGKQEDTGIIVSVGDNNNDTGNNELTDETNDVEEETEVETEAEEETAPVVTDDENMKYITSGFVSDNGDVYKFNVDGTYSCYIVETDVTSKGTYETDGKSYITLKCTETDSNVEEEEIVEEEIVPDENQVPVAYTTYEPSEDGKTTLVTDYDELGNILNQYTVNEVYTPGEEDTKTDDNTDKNEVIEEITYKITRTTTTDEYENVIEVLVLSKGSTQIILQKQFELN